ncbi:hypothetical protein A3C89_01595 [Candidatus Kaiserbacteria bacterium RIFCSPHIGHO2_02_FULL_50_50]|uniref:DNA polymerase III delta N-terminal domain-containing protein n=1 Tax=Candidatus Kaiserbacteria bacterium RIFCSPHIGHO2_02_FULL_50_50 TaxID=1798492 RepID=A0A1F6DCC8_9BACT|nr:MAG: hypothetical protein A3C89_01595 [Candidatus Kaiserbacteria bacterium RIFCSPHIGHO2_02_FULL_50_50]OGG88148.1 MAG: hypothetical protein A3G62_02630 [Candidatus Kaiserbacteria bacterium RIFCSPLOWO2_12_FULL_50_10]
MLLVFYGGDTETARAKMREHLAQDTRQPQWIIATEWYPGRSLEVANTMPLFGGVHLYVLDTPSNDDAYDAEVYASLEAFAQSPHTFVLVEGSLLVGKVKKLQSHAQEIFEFRSAEKKSTFNTFALADALAARDKRSLWVKLHEALRAGESAEAIIGVLWWQLKALALAARTKNAAEADMKDFPYQKAKRALAKFKDGDIEHFMRTLSAVLHEGHGGKRNINDALETWVLSI